MNEDYDVTLRLTEADRGNRDVIAGLFVPDQAGRLVRLDNLVRLVPTQTASRIDRLDRQRQVSLRAGIAQGLRLGGPVGGPAPGVGQHAPARIHDPGGGAWT